MSKSENCFPRFMIGFSIAVVLFAFAVALIPHTHGFKEWPEGGLDFRLRMNEISCLRQGVDPYKVWMEEVSLPPYYRFLISDSKLLAEKGLTKPLNSYPPWEYSFMMPINLIPEKFEGTVYKGILLAALSALFLIAFRVGKREGVDGLLAAGFSMALPYFVFADLFQGNFAILITLSLACMMQAIECRRDWLASLCLAFAMVKPQMGMLFVIPLLMQCRLRVVVGAGVICLLASIYPSLTCGTPVWTMIMEAPKASLHAFGGCNLFPQTLVRLLNVNMEHVMLIPLAIGVGLCALLSWRVRDDPSPVVRFAPAALCSLGWTYAQGQNYILQWFVLLAVLVAARRVGPKRGPLVCLIALVLCQWPVLSLSGTFMYFSGIFRGYQLPGAESAVIGDIWSIVAYAFLSVLFWRVRTVRACPETKDSVSIS